ncbi:MAG: hypothetical protein RL748_2540, partial [Pseudomonadota bacterium]|jgi:tungstate transport system substrate-binding protein
LARRLLTLGCWLVLLCGTQLAHADEKVLRLATTTSTENSGLLGFLLPAFEATSGVKVQVIAVGSGKAMTLAKNGDVDVVLAHARAQEDQFVAAGDGVNRRDVMANDFVLVGPKHDPAGIKGARDVLAALRKIVQRQVKFVSRGDNSGTEQMELSYWQQLGAKPVAPNYLSAGLGMGEVLSMASELQAYTLADRATFSAWRSKADLALLVEGDAKMRNPYGIIAVNPARHAHVNYVAAMQLIEWITSEAGKRKIAAFQVHGSQVFFPAPGPQGCVSGVVCW